MKLEELLKLSKEQLKGKIICFPTDTVYGVGCMIDDLTALEKIYQLKHRDINKPLAILVGNKNDIIPFVKYNDKNVDKLLDQYWPGALTLIFNKKEHILDELVRGKNTIGFRMPNSKIAIDILNYFGPMATTSVNISNQPPLNDLKLIKDEFNDQIDIYIDDLEEVAKISSTIVDVTKVPFQVLREGSIKIK